jgi:RimJ/RimL family protein N-acetyltransferase
VVVTEAEGTDVFVWPEVHAANERAIRAHRACGFLEEEGSMREHVRLAGCYVDLIIMGVLREEWSEGGRIGRGDA